MPAPRGPRRRLNLFLAACLLLLFGALVCEQALDQRQREAAGARPAPAAAERAAVSAAASRGDGVANGPLVTAPGMHESGAGRARPAPPLPVQAARVMRGELPLSAAVVLATLLAAITGGDKRFGAFWRRPAPPQPTEAPGAEGAALCRNPEEEDRQFRALFDGVGDAALLIDGARRIVAANPAAATLFGCESAALTGRDLRCLLPETTATAGAAVLRDGRGLKLTMTEWPLPSVGESRSLVIARAVPRPGSDEARLAALTEELDSARAELDQFAYIASHDLKAPLRVIENAAIWLAEDLAPHLTEETGEHLALLRGRVRRMARLLDDLLALSRAGRGAPDDTPVSGRRIAAERVQRLTLPPGFTLTVAPAFHRVALPPRSIGAVLAQLVGNAVKHHDRAAGAIAIDLADHGEMIELVIADDGPGIAAAYHAKVFEPFQTLKPRDRLESSGIGLAIVRKQVAASGGRIALESDGIRGTTFRVFWPKPDAAPPAEERIAS